MSSPLSRLQAALTANPDIRCRVAIPEITPDHRFRQDLGIDSLGLISLLYELQEHYPSLDESMIASWKTVGDALRSMG